MFAICLIFPDEYAIDVISILSKYNLNQKEIKSKYLSKLMLLLDTEMEEAV